MRIQVVGLVLAGVALAGAASAVEFPARKAGLWGVALSGGPGGRMQMDIKTCVDPSTEKADAMVSGGRRPPGCNANPELSRVPGGIAFHTVCHPPGSGMTTDTRGTATGDFTSAYVVKATTRMTPPPMPNMAEVSTTMTARYLGACPASMKPGQSTVNGRALPAPH